MKTMCAVAFLVGGVVYAQEDLKETEEAKEEAIKPEVKEEKSAPLKNQSEVWSQEEKSSFSISYSLFEYKHYSQNVEGKSKISSDEDEIKYSEDGFISPIHFTTYLKYSLYEAKSDFVIDKNLVTGGIDIVLENKIGYFIDPLFSAGVYFRLNGLSTEKKYKNNPKEREASDNNLYGVYGKYLYAPLRNTEIELSSTLFYNSYASEFVENKYGGADEKNYNEVTSIEGGNYGVIFDSQVSVFLSSKVNYFGKISLSYAKVSYRKSIAKEGNMPRDDMEWEGNVFNLNIIPLAFTLKF